jgi:hypothetical protein
MLGPSVRLGAFIRRHVERAVSRLPYFPDPKATCVAHGDRFCELCSLNPANCAGPDGDCGIWIESGMHWDTCRNRIRPERKTR